MKKLIVLAVMLATQVGCSQQFTQVVAVNDKEPLSKWYDNNPMPLPRHGDYRPTAKAGLETRCVLAAYLNKPAPKYCK